MTKKTGRAGGADERVTLREADTGQFLRVAAQWGSANTSSQAAARQKLREMGIIDQAGKLTPNYKSKG